MNDQNWTQRSLNAVWHPCTQMKVHEDIPLLAIKNGKGVYLYDFEGKAYLDAISSWWTNLFGHAHPQINQALKDQLDDIEHVMLAGLTHQPVVELSERLVRLTHHQLTRVFYGSDGASAVEIALKMCFHYWRNHGFPNKKRFVCLQNSYHGETLGALGVTDIPLFSDTYNALIHSPFLCKSPVEKPSSESKEELKEQTLKEAIDDLRNTFETHHHEIASFIIEPMVQCAAGMQMYDATYLRAVRALCTEFNILLIADEIAVGFGRTGTFFACEHANIWPDLMTLSKGLTGGYLPLSAVLTSEKIYQAFYQDDIRLGFLHSHSYTGNPLACRAAIETLNVFERLDALQRIQQLSLDLANAFSWTFTDSRLGNIRQLGSIFAFDIHASLVPQNFSKTFSRLALERGLLIRPIGSTIYLMPPYIITQNQIEFTSSVIKECLQLTLNGSYS